MIWLAKRHPSFQVSLLISNSLGDAVAHETGEVVIPLICCALWSLGVVLVSGMEVCSLSEFSGSPELVLGIFDKGVRNGCLNEI